MMAPFFNVVVHRENGNRDLNGLCAGFEMKSWRKEQLVNHLMDYIPEFALTYSELESIDARDIRRMLRNAATAIYNSEKYLFYTFHKRHPGKTDALQTRISELSIFKRTL